MNLVILPFLQDRLYKKWSLPAAISNYITRRWFLEPRTFLLYLFHGFGTRLAVRDGGAEMEHEWPYPSLGCATYLQSAEKDNVRSTQYQ